MMQSKKKIIILGVIIAGIYLTFRFLLPLVLPFLIAGIVSIIYYPFLRKLYRDSKLWEGKKKSILLVVSVVMFYVVILLLFGSLCGYLFGQCQSIWLNYPFYEAKVLCFVERCCCQVDSFLRMENGASYTYIETVADNFLGDNVMEMLPKVTTYSVQAAGKVFNVLFEVLITVIATFFMIQDYDRIREKMLETQLGKGFCQVITRCKDTLKTYVKAQGFIMLMDGILCTLAFWLVKQPYFLVLGPLVAVVDALPVFGAGIILFPCAFLLLLQKECGKAVVILLAYVGCLVIRQITEPKMIGGKVGIAPLFTIMSMYIGFKLFGVFGFLLGPVGVLIGKELYMLFTKDDKIGLHF